jgi:hypothetical protein
MLFALALPTRFGLSLSKASLIFYEGGQRREGFDKLSPNRLESIND